MASRFEVTSGILNILHILASFRICLQPYLDLDKILGEIQAGPGRIDPSVRIFEPLHALERKHSEILSNTVEEFENISDKLSDIQEKITSRTNAQKFLPYAGLIAKLNEIIERLAAKDDVLKILALICTANVEFRANHDHIVSMLEEVSEKSPNFELFESKISELCQMKMIDESIRQITERRKGYRISQMTGYVHLSTGANLYFYKHGVRDLIAAAQHFHAAANLGWSQAYYYLGMLYMHGLGVERCDLTCRNFFQTGADADYPAAIAQLSRCYNDGIGVEKSPLKSVLLAKQAAERGDPHGMSFYAYCKLDGYCTEVNHSLAFKFASKAQKSNCALNTLGLCYEQGIQVKRSLTRAIELYTDAMNLGTSWSCRLSLARVYERGDGVEVDLEKAAQLYNSGSELLPWQQPYFQGFYGLCLIRGRGVTEDQKTGWAMVQKSIQGGNATGWYVRGECFRNGYGVERNLAEAAVCYRRAIEMKNGMDGRVFSKFQLGRMYEHGQGGLQVDLRKAFDYYHFAARRMHQEAQCKVALFSETGRGVDKSDDRAAYYFRLAANSGHRHAQVKACEYYMKGKGISRDLHTAVQILQPAADYGDMRAKELLRRAKWKIILRRDKLERTQSAPIPL